MDYAATVGIQVLSSVAMLVLISLGLAVIFGMMRIINIAHGEFLMFGAFAVVLSVKAGVNFWISVLLIAPAVAGLLGAAVERLVLWRLYGRMADTLLATWGLSLFIVGAVTAVVGTTVEGVSPPLGQLSIGSYNVAWYSVVLIVAALTLLAAAFAVLRGTKWGLLARGAMQDPQMAAALGVSTARLYTVTFAVGAALSGLAGGLLAPLVGVVPTMGTALVAKAFITVVGGGAAVIGGTAAAAAIFGTVSEGVTLVTNSVWGEVAMLVAAVLLLRIFPEGISGSRGGRR